jgi:hypothetical protein
VLKDMMYTEISVDGSFINSKLKIAIIERNEPRKSYQSSKYS